MKNIMFDLNCLVVHFLCVKMSLSSHFFICEFICLKHADSDKIV